jgi:alpha-N-arabinofuranosidase
MQYLRLFIISLLTGLCAAGQLAAASSNFVTLNVDQAREVINRNIYGHFAEHLGRCIYEGFWVGEESPIPNTRGIRNDVVAALKAIKIPVLRWPGGCFADEYHWMDGIGPKEKRPAMVNTHWGGVVENNHFGTHEFMELCQQLECEPYICGNLGSGEIREMSQWVEYITFPGQNPMANLRQANGREEPWGLKYFGVGNENWGCGGNMTPEFYADQYKRYATYVRNYGTNRIYKIACGPNGADYKWTEIMMSEAARRMNGLALHFYCGSGRKTRSATEFGQEDWFWQLRNALRMDELVTRHSEIMDKYDPQNRVALIVDEWGAWHAVEPGTNPGFLYQQNTIRDALVAGVNLNIFNNHARRVKMANIAQTVNVLQAMILTDKEKMLLTPTYHVYKMYLVHHDARLVPVEVQAAEYTSGSDTNRLPMISASASLDSGGSLNVTLCNLHHAEAAEVKLNLQGFLFTRDAGTVLTAPEITAHNTFQNPNAVKPEDFRGYRKTENGVTATLPPRAVVLISLKK